VADDSVAFLLVSLLLVAIFLQPLLQSANLHLAAARLVLQHSPLLPLFLQMRLQLLALRRQQLPLRPRHRQLLPQLLQPLILPMPVAAGVVDLHGARGSLEGDVVVGSDLLEKVFGLDFEGALLWIVGGGSVEDGRGGDQLL